MPGTIRGERAAWLLAGSGREAFEQVPSARWQLDVNDVPNARHGAFLLDETLFDNVAFGVSVSETLTMDPQQRHLLELGYSALHATGLVRSTLMGADIAVFVGIMSTEFISALEHSNAYSMTGTGHCFASGRLSYVLGLHGEGVTIDTACSSALVAMHSARRCVSTSDCSNALFAGVNMMFLPAPAHAYAAAGLTSATGRSAGRPSRSISTWT